MTEDVRIRPASPCETEPSIVLLPWGDLIEDFLDGIGVSLESFCKEMSGGWLFGYVDALRSAGVGTTVVCVSGRVDRTIRYTNEPTGATFCVLPAGKSYLRIRRRMRNPYGPSVSEVFGSQGRGRRSAFSVLRWAAPYLATPHGLLIRELRRERYRAILCQEYEYARFDVCVAAGGLVRIPVFATFQGGDWQLSSAERLIRPRTIKACSGLIIAPESEAKRVRDRYGVPPDKIARIFNPLDLCTWQPEDRAAARAALEIPAEKRVVVWRGRIDIHRKGLDVLLDAWHEVVRSADDDRLLLLVGSGGDKEEFRRRIEHLPGSGVRWIDEYVLDRSRIRRYLSAADVYVLPSRHEGFPVAPIEAMACRLPVAATDAPGMADILGDREAAGFIVPRGNGRELARALERLLTDENMARRMGAAARRRIETEFATEVIGSRLRRFLIERGAVLD